MATKHQAYVNDLEPRVARVETSIARLTQDVQELTSSVQNLVISVTKASGPREVDWHLLVGLGGLVLAIGAMAFVPLNQKLQAAEQRFLDKNDAQARIIEAMDKKLQRETELIAKDIQTKVDSVVSRTDKELQNLGDRILSRVNSYDIERAASMAKDLEELRQWRLRAMGLNNKTN